MTPSRCTRAALLYEAVGAWPTFRLDHGWVTTRSVSSRRWTGRALRLVARRAKIFLVVAGPPRVLAVAESVTKRRKVLAAGHATASVEASALRQGSRLTREGLTLAGLQAVSLDASDHAGRDWAGPPRPPPPRCAGRRALPDNAPEVRLVRDGLDS